jgi:putative membrane-bound dehydrogenase-like protein
MSLTPLAQASKIGLVLSPLARNAGSSHVAHRAFVLRLFAAATWLTAASALPAADLASPVPPEASLGQFHLEPGLSIELVACEPQVIDPIAARFDEDGRLWVVEMRDYPHGPPKGAKPLSSIRQLIDRDGDRRYETSRQFADGLLFPTGIQPWRGGLIVTLAGAVVYLKDTDADGRADHSETWYRGFTEENPQLRANHPRLALDGRVVIANGLRGGEVVDARAAAASPQSKPLSISGRDFAFDPRSAAFEAVSGNGQFGLTFDDFGNRFVCNNRAPLQHVVLENKYTARNPYTAVTSVVHDVAASGEQSRVFPLTAAWTTSNLHAGQFTAACGATIYGGDLLGNAYRGNAFVCEPTGSLVHREVLATSGVSFSSRAATEGKEFLASPDAWFRPVNLEIGPDGALYVVDMYRAVIEHPQFMPSELQSRPDLRHGDDRGRIYRIVPANYKPTRAAPKLSSATSAELVDLLRHKNVWWRETAARLLLERSDTSVGSALETLAKDGPEPVARVHALWLLSNLDLLATKTIAAALEDSDAHVREQAVMLAEPRLTADTELRKRTIAAAGNAQQRVRYRVALALGGLESDDVVAPLVSIALAAPDDERTRTAVSTALPSHIGPILAGALQSPAVRSTDAKPGQIELVRELATISGASRDPGQIATLISTLARDRDARTARAREAALLGLARGLKRRGTALADFVHELPDAAALDEQLARLLEPLTSQAADKTLPEADRTVKIELLAYDPSDRATVALVEIVSNDPAQSLRAAAAAALAEHRSAKIGPSLLADFASQTPIVRRAILDTLVARPDRAGLLLDALTDGRIARTEIDSAREDRLKNHADLAIRERARMLLVRALPAERQSVLDDYRAALSLPADAPAGRELFRKHCAVCHRIAGIGVDVAPDISDSRVKTPEQLLVDILNPNQAIDNNYASYTVAMTDGSVHTGIIAAETAGSVTLRQAENKAIDLLRADIEALRANGVSLMPEGFERELSKQQLADVISFVKNWRYLEQSIPGTVSGGK